MTHTSKSPLTQFGRMTRFTLLLLLSANLYAQQPMPVSLEGSAEVPPVTTSATGTVQITIMPDRAVSGTVKTSGFIPTVAHIHEAAAGKNGPPIITLTKTANDSFAVPADAKLTDAQYTSYMAGNLYVNVHSAQHPGGEIRAQLPRPQTEAKPMRPAY